MAGLSAAGFSQDNRQVTLLETPVSIEILKDFLLWCLVVHYAVLIVWFLVFVFWHTRLLKLHARWFKLTTESFDVIHYGGMAVYKIGILLFNLVPFVALSFISNGS